MDKLIEKIKSKRRVKDITLSFYKRNLNKLSNKITGSDLKSIKFLNNFKKVKTALEDYKISTQKNYIATILVALMTEDKNEDVIKKYRTYLNEVNNKYQEHIKTNKKSHRESKNWVGLKELRSILKKYQKKLRKHGIQKRTKTKLSAKEFDILQRWVVASLYLIDDDNPPIRLGYAGMKVISEKEFNKLKDKDDDNYLVVISRNKKYFNLGDYKTQKTHGNKKIPISSKLNTVLNIWLRYNKTGYLLLNKRKEPMSRNSLTKYLNSTFNKYLEGNKKISSTMIRHIFITDTFGDTIKKMENTADKMLHTKDEQQKTYYKKD